jgi:LacI family transcriptional regulator
MKRATLKTVALQLGLSVTTVSRALKNGPEVRPETIARVKQVATELGYMPHQGGLFLRTGRTHIISLILSPEPQSAFPAMGFMYYCQGIIRALKDSAYTLSIQPRLAHEDLLKPIQRIVEGRLADGVIIGQTRDQDLRVKYLLENEFPFVTFGRTELFTPHAYYDVLHERITYESVKRFQQQGHQRIALINPPTLLNYTGHRLKGYHQALREAGIPQDESLILNTELSFETGRQALQQFRRLSHPPTAILSPGVSTTLGLLAEMRECGMRLPQDLDLIAFEGTNYLEFNSPRINAYHSSLEHAGEQLCRLLLRRLEGDPPEALQVLHTPEFRHRAESG